MKILSLCSATVLVLACSGPALGPCPAGQAASGSSECLQTSGQSLRSLQGHSLQGRTKPGNGTEVATVVSLQVGGVAVDNPQLQGTLLVGSVGGQTLSGTDFIGATVTQRDVDGTLFNSTIANVQLDPQDVSGEIWLYTLTTYDASSGTQVNLCSADPWGGQYATAMYGSWDGTAAYTSSSTQFAFGCTSGVIAKCIRWGYKPWKSVNGHSLASYHQTCTRMARADYCGDGVSHTQDGTLIDLYDDLGVQHKSPLDLTSLLVFDGAWTTRGAYCVTKDRWVQLSTLVSGTLSCKSKFQSLFPLFETSPVDPTDVCLVKRTDVSRSDVHLDNQSGINVSLN